MIKQAQSSKQEHIKEIEALSQTIQALKDKEKASLDEKLTIKHECEAQIA